jgi:hypothetical protein
MPSHIVVSGLCHWHAPLVCQPEHAQLPLLFAASEPVQVAHFVMSTGTSMAAASACEPITNLIPNPVGSAAAMKI